MARYLLFIFFIAISYAGITQEQLTHKKKFYINENGRFYVNKDLPFYLRVSTSPDPNAESHLLRSESSPQYSNPFYFDTEGYNTIRTPSQVDTVTKKVVLPKQDIIFEIYTDESPPELDFSYSTKHVYSKNGKTFTGKNSEIEITAKDELSGVQDIYISIDSAGFQKYTAPIKCNTEKNYKVKFYAVDNVGNFNIISKDSDKKMKNFVVDLTPPKTKLNIEGDKYNNILAANAVFSLSANDIASGVKKTYYIIDDGPKNVYYSDIKIGKYKEGEHTITFYSIDHVNNEEKHQSYTFYLDKTPPMVLEEIIGDQFVVNGKEFSSGRTKLKLTAIDNKAGVKEIMYSVAGEDYQEYSEPFYLPKRQGSMNIKFYATDNVENKSTGSGNSGGLSTYVVDLTGPTLDHSYIGQKNTIHDTTFINKNTKIKLEISDKESGSSKITYTIDNQNQLEYSEPFVVKKEGFHTISYTGYDNVNNTTILKFFFVVDNTGPEVFKRFGIVPIDKKTIEGRQVEVYPLNTVLYLSATDKLVGVKEIYYSLNGSTEKKYNMYVLGFKHDTYYKMKMRAIDMIGNETTNEFEFYIE